MAKYRITTPGGEVFEITAPEGATQEQVLAYAQANAKKDNSQSAAADMEKMRKEYDPANGMSGFDKFVAGYGKAGSDLVRGVGQMIPTDLKGGRLVSRDDVAESRKLDQSLMDTGAGMAGNVVGNVANMAPTAMIPGANTVTGGATIGAVSGLLQPSTSTGETLRNTGVGAVAGGAVPLAINTFKTAKSFLEPLYEGGRDKIVGRAITDAAATDPKTLAQALRGNKSAVPGVERTVAEVADNPSLAALQRTATQTSPAVMNEAAARQAANSDARTLALKSVAPDRQAAQTARETATKALYRQSDALPVDTTQLATLLERPSMKEAVNRASKLAAEAGETFDVQNLTGRGAHYMKMAMDDIASGGPASGIGGNEARAVRDTLTQYLGKLETQLPSYGQARTAYKDLSRPLNQADVVDEIAKSANFRGDLTPAAYARALRDETAQRVTGQPNATMAGVMEPGQMSSLNAIKDDLLKQDFAQTAGKGGGSDTVQKLAYSNMLNQAGVPSAVRNFGPSGIVGNVAQRAGQIVYKDANEKLAERLARALLNPDEASELVAGGMVNPQLAALSQALRRGGTALGASTPGLVQANQK